MKRNVVKCPRIIGEFLDKKFNGKWQLADVPRRYVFNAFSFFSIYWHVISETVLKDDLRQHVAPQELAQQTNEFLYLISAMYYRHMPYIMCAHKELELYVVD